LGFLGLGSRFWYLQVLRASEYKLRAEANQMREISLLAPRGVVFDRHGRVLAENRPSFNLTIENMPAPTATIGRVAALLSTPADDMLARAEEARRRSPFAPFLAKEDLSYHEVAWIEARQLELPETEIQFVPRRYYPGGSLAAHVLGHVGRISPEQFERREFQGASPNDYVGQSGVEFVYNQALMGQNGIERVVVNSRGLRERSLARTPPRWGDSIDLTLDLDLQRAAEEALGANTGAVVALDPRSGEILALLSSPSFDPNLFSGRFDSRQWKALAEGPDQPLSNRAIQGRYAPGSVFKLVVAAAALEEGVVSPDTRFFCPGWVRLYGTTFHCHLAGGHGWVDLHQALVRSCNVYFWNAGVKLQIDRIARYARALGLGAPTGIDLPHEVSGLVPEPEWKRRVRDEPWYAGETASVAVGQGAVLVTAVQLAQLSAIIATGGDLYGPHLFARTRPARLAGGDGEREEPGAPKRRIPFRPSTWRGLQDALWSAVNEGGTGYAARVEGVDVCGKTGTAQVASRVNVARDPASRPEHLRSHAWFVGFAPRSLPEVAIAVLVEHGGSGAQGAAPIAGELFRAYFRGEARRDGGNARQAFLARD
jgi:penicillin-binding protein 2